MTKPQMILFGGEESTLITQEDAVSFMAL